jgi:hypothetical protein
MSESAPPPSPTSAPGQPPLSIAGRSPFDARRLQWQGAGNILLALYCIFGAGGAGGVFFGILFLLLALATWVIAFRADWNWYSIPPDYRRVIVAVGAAIGVTFTYIFFGIFFLVIWICMHLADWM